MKKLFAIILSLAMVLSLAACGGKEAASTDRTEAPAEKPAETPAAPAAPSAGGDAIKIGMYMAMTGTNAGSGLTHIEGVQQAIDKINAEGGIDGRQLELIVYDDAGSTEGATKAVTRLIEEDGVQVIIGSFQSPNVIACMDMTEAAKVLHIGGGTGATWTNCGSQYTFRATAIASLTIDTMVKQMVDMGSVKTALISVESEYGQSGRASVTAALEAAGIALASDLTYQSADTDFTGIITKTMAANPDSMVLYGLGNELAMIIKQLRQNGYEGPIYTIEGGANSEIFTVAGASADGLIFSAAYIVPTTPAEAPTPFMQDVLQVYYDAKGEMPYSDTFYRGYDGMMLVGEALKNCDNPDSGESIRNAFVELKGIELCGGTFDYTAGTGDGLNAANQYMIMDGVIKTYDKAALQAFFG